MAWIIGWDLVLQYLFGASTVAVGWSGYVVSFLADWGVNLPAHFTNAPFEFDTIAHQWVSTRAILNVPAILIMAIITTLLIIGSRESARFSNVIVLVKVGVTLLFVLFGISYINTENWVPFIPENEGAFGRFGSIFSMVDIIAN